MSSITNLFADLPRPSANEQLLSLLERPGLRIERIVSHGHATPAGKWYDQADDEWVMVLRGSAELELEGRDIRSIGPGDFLLIPAHARHRVRQTARGEPTIWLAVHLTPESSVTSIREASRPLG